MVASHTAEEAKEEKEPRNWYFGSKPLSYGQRNEKMKKMWREWLLAERDRKRIEANKLKAKLG